MFGTKYLSSYGTYEFQAYFLHSSFNTFCNKKIGILPYVRIFDNEDFFSKRYVYVIES